MRLKAVVAAVLVVAAFSVRSSTQSGGTPPFVAGEVLVKFKPGVNGRAVADAHRASAAQPPDEIPRTRVQRVRVRVGDELAAIARYRRNPNVLYAEPNFIRSIPTLELGAASDVVPRDTYFGEQWALENTGQPFYCIPWIPDELCLFAGTADADIDAPEAWAISTGNSAITVAVIDSGVDYTHPDLAPNYAGGVDFVFFDGDPMDDHGHGTHVAGTIAAALNNLTGNPSAEEGVAGVAPNARIRAYKVCRSDGTCTDFAIQQAIARAIADGANVINMSLGQPAYSQSLDDAVQDAWNAGLVIVAGAGNDGVTDRFYPAAFDNVISVAAFDEDHLRPEFSNYGTWVDLSAPGNLIMSTYPMATCGGVPVPGDIGCYEWLTGTSMATPHVSGAAALVWSRSDVTSNSQVVEILLGSADRQGVASVRLDSWTINGGLNLHAAMTYSTTNPTADAGPDQSLIDSDGNGSEPVTLDGSASSDPDGSIVSYEWRDGSTPIATGATPAVSLAAGVHTLTLEVTDDDGNTATDEVVVTIGSSRQVTVSASTAQATEAGPTNGAFTVSRSGDTSTPLTVFYTVGGAATAGADYQSLPGSVTIEAGAATAIVTVTPIDDQVYEIDESVVLTLTANEAYGIGAPAAATVTVVSDDLPADLIVVSVTAPVSGGADADIVVSDTTKNQGAGSSSASVTGFFLSTNVTLDAADVFLGSRPVPSLGPGVTDVLSTTLHVPAGTAPGSYNILAQADWGGVVDESVETNNVRTSGAVKIGPDLLVSALTTPTSLAAGAAFSVSDTTKNQGGGSAPASVTRFHLSVNTVLDAGDIVLGTRPAAPLAPGASESVNTSLTLPAETATGTYFVLAEADAADGVPETLESNNVRLGPAVKVGPDLVLTALTAPAGAAPGATISVTDTIKNQGAGVAAASSTAFYLSTNTAFDAADLFLGSRPVGALAAEGTATASTPLQVPADTAPGNYFVIGRADWNSLVAETSETNNTKPSAVIKVGGDLVLTALTAPATGPVNGSITVTDTIRNQGAAPVSETVTGFYLSPDTSFDPTDVFLGSRVVGALAVSAISTASTPLVIPAGTEPGSYFVIGIADMNEAVIEGLETNNARASGVMRLGSDLVVTVLTAPTSAVAGTSITAGDTTKNQGGDTAVASSTTFFLSTNSTLDAADVPLGSRLVPSLGPGLSHAGSASLVIPASTAAGTYFIIAKGDGDNTIVESLETNNTRTKSISISAAP